MRTGKMPLLSDMLGGRRLAMENGGSIKDDGKYPFFYFCNAILECVAGKKEWKQQKNKQLISGSCVTVTDEAFALLLMVNSWEKFEYMADNPEMENKTEVPETRYTEKKGRNRKMQGWSSEGIDKFNNLCVSVMADRESEEGKMFEKEFLEYHEQKAKENKIKAQASGDEEEDSECEENGGDGPPTKRLKWAFNHLGDLAGVGLNGTENSE